MSIRIYFKDNTNELITGITSSKPYPQDDNFAAGLAGDGSIIAVIPLKGVVAIVDEN